MRYIRFCVVMISVIAAACFLSFIAHQKYSKKDKISHEKTSSNEWKKDCARKISGKTPEWMLKQILSDLSPFASTGISSKMINVLMRQADKKGQLVHYRIENNQIAVIQTGKILASERLEDMTLALQTLCTLAPLPNMDFILCLDDAIDGIDLAAPVLAFAKHQRSNEVILIPDFDALSNQSAKLLQTVEHAIKKYPWKKKISKAFWRGATTGAELSEDNFLSIPRSEAVRFSLERPSLVDARFTHLVQCANPKLIHDHFPSYFSTPRSVKTHLKYKYQLLIDGNTCAYSRAYWQLFSNCAILKQSSPNIQWFYSLLKPYIHYIPLQNDLRDLPEKILWSQDHDKEVRQIISNAQTLAQENLKRSDVYHYLYLVLVEYAKLQTQI